MPTNFKSLVPRPQPHLRRNGLVPLRLLSQPTFPSLGPMRYQRSLKSVAASTNSLAAAVFAFWTDEVSAAFTVSPASTLVAMVTVQAEVTG